jgi:hypothetical protein
MTIARKIDRGVLVVLVFALALPALARANPLLSGYGGPGQGSQVLLGSTLTRGGGGDGGGGGASAAGGSPSGSIEAAPESGGAATTQGDSSASTRSSARSGHSSRSRHHAAGTGSSAGATQTTFGFAPARSVHTDAAGLSTGDLALIVLAIGVIAVTGVLMARLARGQEREGRGS